MRKTSTCVLAGMMMTAAVFGNDWPQFCGLDRDNHSAETGLAKSWPASGPQVLWETAVSRGYAGPSIKAGKVYLLDRDGQDGLLRCLDLASGAENWKCTFRDPGELKAKKYDGTRGTPTVTDDSLYAVTLFGTVIGVDLKSHEVKWQRSLVNDYGKKPNGWGVAQSPLLYGDLVIIAPLTESSSLVALDKNSGKEVWKVSGFPGSGFVSPMMVSIEGEDQVVMVAGGSKPPKPGRKDPNAKEEEPKPERRPTCVVAVSPKDGTVLWRYDDWFCDNPIPHPVQISRNTLFITGGYKSVSTILQVQKKEGAYAVKELFKTEDAAVQIEQPVFANNHLFVGGTVKKPSRGLVCMDLDGKVKWDSNEIQGAPVFEHLNMIAADGMLIGLDGDAGTVNLIEATPTAFNLLASAKVLAEKGQTWAPMALSDGKLLVRDHKVMKCLQLK